MSLSQVYQSQISNVVVHGYYREYLKIFPHVSSPIVTTVLLFLSIWVIRLSI